MAEGMPPSAVNDGVRALMARAAEYRDDIAGALTTSGTSTAYTLATNQVFDSLAHMANAMVAFVPHTTNGATVTLSVDGLTAKPLRSAPNVELQTGALIQGTPYVAFYNSSDGAFYLHSASNYNSYSIPLGGGLPYFGTSAPNSAFAFPYGQAISRTTYATLFSLISTTYGTGDGSTTFNIPDLRGRVIAGLDNMGGSSAARLSTAMTSTTLGNTGGVQQVTLGTSNLPAYTPGGSVAVTDGAITLTVGSSPALGFATITGSYAAGGSAGPTSLSNIAATQSGTTAAFTGTAQGGTSTPFTTIQPTMVTNFILRII